MAAFAAYKSSLFLFLFTEFASILETEGKINCVIHIFVSW